MAIRTALLNWNNISRDTDFSKYIETVSEAGVIEWLEVSATKVWIWKARVPCERTNGETIYALVYNSSEVTISGNGDVYIEVSQTYIDDWELANEDWTGIATIQVWTMPSKNALKLATITDWTVVDNRNMIPKLWELNTQIVSIFEQLADLDERVEKLEEAGAIDHLEESGLVWELYTLEDTLFKQYTPKLADSTLDCNVWDIADNTEIHIQRQWSKVASNQLKLKIKSVWSPTTWLVVEVRKWVQVTVTENVEAYWYGDEVVATGSIAYWDITNNYAEFTVTLDNQFWWTKWELLDVVIYQTWSIVNATNYYCVACDSTQFSEWFSYVSVNGTTRTRSKFMPYCISDGFAQSLLCKTGTTPDSTNLETGWWYGRSGTLFTAKTSNYHLEFDVAGRTSKWYLYINGTQVWGEFNADSNTNTPIHHTYDFTWLNVWDIVSASIDTQYNDGQHYIWNFVLTPLASVSMIPLTPKTIENIGDLIYLTLYGRDGEKYYGGIITGTTNSVTTGGITPWNFVGYLEINYNGSIVKVPYYN